MKKTILVPDSWDEIKVSQFQEIASLDKDSKDYSINIASIILDKDPEEIRNYDINSANNIMKSLEWVIKYPSEDSYKQEITVEGVVYKMIDNLNGFSNGDWFNMEDYLEDPFSNLHYLFAMFYRPVEKENEFMSLKERGKIFAEKVNIGDVYGSFVFFSNVGKKSMMTIQDYLTKQIPVRNSQRKTKKKNLKKQANGVGIASTTN